MMEKIKRRWTINLYFKLLRDIWVLGRCRSQTEQVVIDRLFSHAIEQRSGSEAIELLTIVERYALLSYVGQPRLQTTFDNAAAIAKILSDHYRNDVSSEEMERAQIRIAKGDPEVLVGMICASWMVGFWFEKLGQSDS